MNFATDPITYIKATNISLDAKQVVTQMMGISIHDIKPSTEGFRLNCPLHSGKNSFSLTINISTNKYECKKPECDAKGDIIDLYARYSNISSFVAAKTIAEQFCISNTTIQTAYAKRESTSIIKAPDSDISFDVWDKASDAGDHPYFKDKKVVACTGLRYGTYEFDNQPSILIPFKNVNGQLRAIGYIKEDHTKPFAKGSKTSGAFFVINNQDPTHAKKAYVAEGLATALTIHNAVKFDEPGCIVISCGSSGNMLTVIESLRLKYANLELVACPDQDTAGQAVAKEILQRNIPLLKIIIPNFDGLQASEKDTDLNDLQNLAGIETVKQQLQDGITQIQSTTIKPAIETELFEHPLTIQDEIVQPAALSDGSGLLEPDNILAKIKLRMKLFKDNGNKSILPGLSTGYLKLDDLIGGFQKGHLIAFGGRTGHGKSWVILNFIINVSIDKKTPSLLISLEMSKEQVEYRLLSLLTGISYKSMKNGSVPEKSLKELEDAYFDIITSPIHIEEDMKHDNLQTLETRIRKAHKDGIEFVVIDHIGLIHKSDGGNYSDNRVIEVANITRTIKTLTKSLNISILMCVQLNRDADNTERPKGNQLRESDTAKQDSDILILLYRPDKYDAMDRPGELELIIDKNRDGEETIVSFTYDKNSWKLSEIDTFQVNGNNKNPATKSSSTNENQQEFLLSKKPREECKPQPRNKR